MSGKTSEESKSPLYVPQEKIIRCKSNIFIHNLQQFGQKYLFLHSQTPIIPLTGH